MMLSRPHHYLGGIAQDIVNSHHFEIISLMFVVLNTIAVAAEFSSQPTAYATVIFYIYLVVTVELGIEVIIQAIASASPAAFFSNLWNVFDLVVVILSGVLGLLNQFSLSTIDLGLLQVLRVVRVSA